MNTYQRAVDAEGNFQRELEAIYGSDAPQARYDARSFNWPAHLQTLHAVWQNALAAHRHSVRYLHND